MHTILRLLMPLLAVLLLTQPANSVKSLNENSTALSTPVVDAAALDREIETINGHIEYHSFRAGVDPLMVYAVIAQESSLNPQAINEADPAYGLGQVMPRYWRHAFVEECGQEATPQTLMEPELNVCYTAHIIGKLKRIYGRDQAALSHYNTGHPTKGASYAEAVQRRIRTGD